MLRPNIALSRDLDSKHKGETIVIVGCAQHINTMDLHPLSGITTIGCNRILMHPYFRPTYLMVSDRRPYMAEMKAGRYKKWSSGIHMMFSTSLYDPLIICHHTPVQTPPKDFPWTPWRVRGSKSAMNWETLSESVNSFANIGGAMLQAAVIMGAERVVTIGVGIPSARPQHFYKEREDWGGRSGPVTEHCFRRAKSELDKLEIPVHVCSPKRGKYEEIFGRYPYEQFLREEGLA